MKVLLLAIGSAVCALGCLADAIVGTVTLLFHWRSGLAVLGMAVVLGVAAKALDRLKMRAIYGWQRGDQLHEDSCECQTSLDLAERDLAAYLHGEPARPAECAQEVA